MSARTVIVLAILLAMFLWVMASEIALEKELDFYRCYTKREYRRLAEYFRCPGDGGRRCKRCPYNKRWWKERKDEDGKEL